MSKSYSLLRDRMSPERRQRNSERTKALLEAQRLDEIRKAMSLTQQQMAESLAVSQTAVSKIERQADMYVSTLGRFIEAMGGELRIVAHFPDGDIPIRFTESGEER